MIKDEKKYLFKYNMKLITILSFIFTFIVIVTTVIFCEIFLNFDINKTYEAILVSANTSKFWISYIGVFMIMNFWMVLHEIIHAITYVIMGAKKENITFGVVLEKGILYCRCNEYITRKNMLTTLITPLITIGIITYILGFIIHSYLLIFLSCVNIIGATGDIIIFFFFLFQDEEIKVKEIEDSTKFIIKSKYSQVNTKSIGTTLLKRIKDEEELEEKNNKFVNISKPSIILIALYIILAIILMILGFIGG